MHNRRGSVKTTWGDGDGRRLPLPSLPFSTKAGLNTTHNNNHRHPRPPPSRSRERGDRSTPNSSSHQKGAPLSTRHNKLQRRSSHAGITAGFAQEMIAEMVSANTNSNKAKIEETVHVKQTSSHHHGPRRHVTVSHQAPSNLQLQEQLRQSQEAARYENNLYKAPSSSSSSPLKEEDQEEEPTTRHMGFRSDYTLGEYSRHPSHMIIPQTTACIDTLGRYDFAFVKRSNGTYSYSILAYRTNSTDTTSGSSSSDIHDEKGECMAFVIDDIGSTKIISKKYWKKYIRLVASEEEQSHQDHHPLLPVSQGDHSKKKKKNVVFCQEITVASYQEMPHNHHRGAQEEVNHDQDDQEEDECDKLPDMIVFRPQENHDDECSLISSISDKARMK